MYFFFFFFCIITKFKLSQINLGEIVYFNETIVKIVLILLESPHSQCTDVKHVFSFCGLIVNSGMKLITKNINKNTPTIHDFKFSKQKLCVCSFSKEGKELM